jgi:hypothetical protein
MNDKPIAGVMIMGIREDYQTLMEKQLNEWKAQTERFKAGAEQIEAHTKVQYEKHLETLRATQAGKICATICETGMRDLDTHSKI